jgi:signal transduction histidine kinase/HAMP domain-containing protein
VLGLRGKLLAGLAGLLAVLIAVTVISNSIIARYSDSIQNLFHDDYGSAAACQAMKEAVESMTAIAERRVWGDTRASLSLAEPSIDRFNRDLKLQEQIADVPGEAVADEQLRKDWSALVATYQKLFDPALSIDQQRQLYSMTLLPQSQAVRSQAQRLIDMNIRFMTSGRGEARLKATHAHLAMHILTGVGVGIAALIVILCGTFVLRPLRLLTSSARDISQGKLDLNLDIAAHDEIGLLARTFNDMAAQLRQFKRLDQEKLVRTQHTTQLAIDSLPDAVVVLDPTGNIELSNQTATRLCDLHPGMPIHGCNLRALAELFETGGAHAPRPAGYRAAIRVEDDGRTRYFLPRTYDIRDEASVPIGTVLVLVDVTDFRRLDEMKNNLLSMVAHELKTPLTSMRMIMHVLGEGRVSGPAEQQELITAAREDTDRLHQIIENLLDMGRLESGKALMEVREVPADELARQCAQPLQSSFDARGVTLSLDLPEHAPLVKADQTRMLHVFGNLLSNALRYTPAGGAVTVALRSVSPGEVQFTVADTGSGIPPEHLPRLFDKFFRVPGQPGGTGSGLGLAIVKDVVEAHGGRIWVESQPGAGTTFFFTLPTAAHSVQEQNYAAAVG